MPWFVFVCHTTTSDNLVTLDATGGEFLFVTLSTVDFLFTGNEALGTNRNLAYVTTETFLVPLSCFILHFLGTSSEDFVASIASGSKLLIVTASAVNPIALGSKLFIYKGFSTGSAQEASFMPVLVFIGQVLGVDANGSTAFLAGVSENGFVAGDAVRMVITKDVTLAS